MATNMFTLQGPDGAVFDVVDNAGTLELQLDGATIAVGTTQTAIASLTGAAGGTANGSLVDQLTVTAITDSTTGTADGTLADVGGAFSQATLNNNFADLAAKVNTVVTDLTVAADNTTELAAKVEAILVALRAYGVIAA